MNKVESFLQKNEIRYTRHDHPAVFTCEDAKKYSAHIAGISTKNLFLVNKSKNRYFLLIIPDYKRADLKRFAQEAGEPRVSFASAEKLFQKLGLEPGSVSPFGLINNYEHDVILYIDEDVYKADIVGFHPNDNTATLELTGIMFKKYLDTINYSAITTCI